MNSKLTKLLYSVFDVKRAERELGISIRYMSAARLVRLFPYMLSSKTFITHIEEIATMVGTNISNIHYDIYLHIDHYMCGLMSKRMAYILGVRNELAASSVASFTEYLLDNINEVIVEAIICIHLRKPCNLYDSTWFAFNLLNVKCKDCKRVKIAYKHSYTNYSNVFADIRFV